MGRPEESIVDATEAINLSPDTNIVAHAHIYRATSLDALGETDEAVVELHIVLGLVPPTHELYRIAAGVLAELGFSE